ncbi:MAG: hypothetical protein AseanaTS_04470 [Candidatus Pelagadaptatus aseana]|uniref:TRAP transporter small permease subunit n=1 Tax=Candidatus Pelagadaptatus aseana TaxID=3120508 RepID=UPI0039B18A16
MVIVTLAVVVLRYGLSIGSVALQESITYMHAAVFLLGAAYTLKRDGHVRVDIFYRKFSPTRQAWVNAIGGIVFLLPLCAFMVFISWDFAASSWRIREASGNADGIPAVFLLKSMIPLMAITLALQGLAETLKSLLILIDGSEQEASDD